MNGSVGPGWVILDRDGVINEDSDRFIRTPDEWRAVPGSLEAIADLTQAGWRVAVLSNQSGIARGYLTEPVLQAIHEKMLARVEAAGGRIGPILYCPHGPGDGCGCRKPETGLFQELADEFHVELRGVPAVGDGLRDLQAAEAAGCVPHLVRTGKGVRTVTAGGLPAATRIHDDLHAFATYLLSSARGV